MKCPQCLFDQPDAGVCVACGYVVASVKPRYAHHPDFAARQDASEARQGGRGSAPSPVSVPPASYYDSPYDRPIRASLRWIRSVGGLLGAMLGAWLFIFGQDIVMTPLEVVLILIYGMVSLFWLLSAPIRVSIRQFAIEVVFFTGAALALFAMMPEAFDVNRLSRSGDQTHRLLVRPSSGGTATLQDPFVAGAWQLVELADRLIADPSNRELLSQWKTVNDTVQGSFPSLPAESRARWTGTYKTLSQLLNRLESMVESGYPSDVREAARVLQRLRESLRSPGEDPGGDSSSDNPEP